MVPEYQAGLEDLGAQALPSTQLEPEVLRAHQEDQSFQDLLELQEGHCDQGALGLPLFLGIQEHRAVRCLPLYQGHQEDQRDLGIPGHQHLPSVQGIQAGREHQVYPSPP